MVLILKDVVNFSEPATVSTGVLTQPPVSPVDILHNAYQRMTHSRELQ
jgi:hypothetical protein